MCRLGKKSGLVAMMAAFAAAGCASTVRPSPAPTASIASAYSSAPGERSEALRMVAVLPAPSGTRNGLEQLVEPNDVLDVDVFQVDDLDRTVQVDADGRFSLPLVGVVDARGKSLRSLEDEIERLYGARYLQDPQVALFMKESAGRKVTVDGEVMRAGLYPVTAGSTLQQAIAEAGGFRPIGDPSQVFVFRTVGVERLVAGYDMAAIRAGRRPDPRIFGGDTVVVFSSAGRVALEGLKEALGIARNAALIGP